jgi:hypothetical protein
MRIVTVLDFLYSVNPTAMVTVVDHLSDIAKRDMFQLADRQRDRLLEVAVPTEAQVRYVNFLTYLLDAIEEKPLRTLHDMEELDGLCVVD